MLLCIDADVYTYPGCPQFHLLLQKRTKQFLFHVFYCYYAQQLCLLVTNFCGLLRVFYASNHNMHVVPLYSRRFGCWNIVITTQK
jgi:hypothetical protein